MSSMKRARTAVPVAPPASPVIDDGIPLMELPPDGTPRWWMTQDEFHGFTPGNAINVVSVPVEIWANIAYRTEDATAVNHDLIDWETPDDLTVEPVWKYPSHDLAGTVDTRLFVHPFMMSLLKKATFMEHFRDDIMSAAEAARVALEKAEGEESLLTRFTKKHDGSWREDFTFEDTATEEHGTPVVFTEASYQWDLDIHIVLDHKKMRRRVFFPKPVPFSTVTTDRPPPRIECPTKDWPV